MKHSASEKGFPSKNAAATCGIPNSFPRVSLHRSARVPGVKRSRRAHGQGEILPDFRALSAFDMQIKYVSLEAIVEFRTFEKGTITTWQGSTFSPVRSGTENVAPCWRNLSAPWPNVAGFNPPFTPFQKKASRPPPCC